ncbi:type II secretion system protein GspD [Desulfobulbus rhabdoformis]|uniref:type II secretion system protein GspD n=1 Tax=Desulfobulbus rhabdoformis TaxID=34032 RepID=UPI00196488C3|nr:type II secretion system protein GspD [Desulfobulbus rhabdoformis]MBM9612853.1 type II secretion system protein GspD [Desulfobulbus rhabdoformis]
MKGWRTITWLAAMLLVHGCGYKERQGALLDGHPFSQPPQKARPTQKKLLPPPPAEKPIVKIISGNRVSGMEEAQALMRQHYRSPLGLRTEVEQLAVNEIPLIQVAATLSEMSGFNIAVSRKAADLPITTYLHHIPLRQALESICRLNDLWYREDERIITLMTTEEYASEMVIRRNEKSRAYWLRYTNANDMAKILQAVMSAKIQFNDIGSEEVYGHVKEEKEAGEKLSVDEETSKLASLDSKEVKKLVNLGELDQHGNNALALSKKIDKSVPAVLTVFKRNNSIIARSLDESILEDIGRIIELMDTPTSQVLLEIAILQINLTGGFESFFQVDYSGDLTQWTDNGIAHRFRDTWNTMGSTSGPPSPTSTLLFGNEHIQARLALYARDDRVKVLSTPYLMSANNSKVEFFIGQEVPLRDDVESKVLYNDEGDVTSTMFEVTVNREELGTDIEISSFINEDGTITMDLEAEISSPQYNMTTIGVANESTGEVVQFPLDGKETNELTSIVTAASGQTIALGGIIREELMEYENKVPLLGDIPGLGFFFKDISDTKEKTETVILLTPHIIRHPELAGAETERFLERRSSHPLATHGVDTILDFPTKDKNEQEKIDAAAGTGTSGSSTPTK